MIYIVNTVRQLDGPLHGSAMKRTKDYFYFVNMSVLIEVCQCFQSFSQYMAPKKQQEMIWKKLPRHIRVLVGESSLFNVLLFLCLSFFLCFLCAVCKSSSYKIKHQYNLGCQDLYKVFSFETFTPLYILLLTNGALRQNAFFEEISQSFCGEEDGRACPGS